MLSNGKSHGSEVEHFVSGGQREDLTVRRQNDGRIFGPGLGDNSLGVAGLLYGAYLAPESTLQSGFATEQLRRHSACNCQLAVCTALPDRPQLSPTVVEDRARLQ